MVVMLLLLLILCCFYDFVKNNSPEFSYRPGLVPVSEDSTTPMTHGSGGPPNRPLPPTPDDDDQAGDRTLIMKRVSHKFNSQYIIL